MSLLRIEENIIRIQFSVAPNFTPLSKNQQQQREVNKKKWG